LTKKHELVALLLPVQRVPGSNLDVPKKFEVCFVGWFGIAVVALLNEYHRVAFTHGNK
jgi:hypothetical protein